MVRLIIGLYRHLSEARQVLRGLESQGFKHDRMRMYSNDQDGYILAVLAEDEQAEQVAGLLGRSPILDPEILFEEWRQEDWRPVEIGDPPGPPDELHRHQARYGHNMGVEELHLKRPPAERDFESYRPRFKEHFTATYADASGLFEEFEPAYRFGYRAGSNNRYAHLSWPEVEEEIRPRWEKDYPNSPWETHKEAIRQAWASLQST